MDDVVRVAEGLTEAQRRAVTSAEWRESDGAWRTAGWYVCADRRVRYNLRLAGILTDYLNPWNKLLPLGLAVRKYLEERDAG